MNAESINRHVQATAIQFISYRGDIRTMASYVGASMGDIAPDIEQLAGYLRKPETHEELLKWGVGIWRNTAGDWSLVSLTAPSSIEQMRYRLEHFPTSNTQCRWCLQDTKRLAHIELIPEKDIYGNPVDNSFLHKYCMRPWLTMRNQVARAGTAKESFL
ncbi:hypothetical protein QTN23_06965 [Pseudomonas shirazica]|uniref:hypothetical protein n=1 Tax=Pseudomonas shirazica TaxID=1940636 RepID=UPI0025A9B2A8|nr:hypothetical protein [Pseudomonas shirazica]MDM9599227.1 hypothetical protein [Pseudomonas shirazica]MDO2412655.1 hypothetical protein [Pseudomonas shirazica]